eukprot:g59208.t1
MYFVIHVEIVKTSETRLFVMQPHEAICLPNQNDLDIPQRSFDTEYESQSLTACTYCYKCSMMLLCYQRQTRNWL